MIKLGIYHPNSTTTDGHTAWGIGGGGYGEGLSDCGGGSGFGTGEGWGWTDMQVYGWTRFGGMWQDPKMPATKPA